MRCTLSTLSNLLLAPLFFAKYVRDYLQYSVTNTQIFMHSIYFKLQVLYHILHLLQNYNTIPPMPYLVMLSMEEEVNSYPKWIVSWDKINEVKQETMKAVFDE